MCHMCDQPDHDGPPREYAPLQLQCKTPALANALRVILTEMGAGLRTFDGSTVNPYVDGDTLVMPWGGTPKFVNGVTLMAMNTQIATVEAIREMSYGAMAQGLATDVENVRRLGETVSGAIGEFMSTIGSDRPPDIESIMSTLDAEINAMQQDRKDDRP